MKVYKSLVVISLLFLVVGCGNNPEANKNNFALSITNAKKSYTVKDMLVISLANKKQLAVDSVVYYIDAQRVLTETTGANTSFSLANQKLGKRTITAKVYSEGKTYNTSEKATLVSSIKPKLYTYKILETYPHDSKAFTQGLEFSNDTLYESTGLYKESTLRKTDYKKGKVLQEIKLKDTDFGEGLTVLNNQIYQLTWQEKKGYIYDLKTLAQTGTFVYGSSQEGWGLCNDGTTIYKSDGTEKIWTLNPNTLSERSYIEVYTNTSKIKSVNELEWVNGKIYANVFEKGSIAIIDPSNGAVEGVIDLTSLKDKVTQHADLSVMNGIAFNGEENIIYVTGKKWDKLFKVEIIEK